MAATALLPGFSSDENRSAGESPESQLDDTPDGYSPEPPDVPDALDGQEEGQRDEDETETLPRSYEFLQKFPPEQDETEDHYINRVNREFQKLRDRHPEFACLNFGDLKPTRGPRGALDPTWGPNVDMLINNVRNSARVSLLIDLVGCNVDILLSYAMRGLGWPDELKAYAYFTARKRLKSNMSTWKHRALKNLKNYIRDLMRQDVEGDFSAEVELPRLQRYLERRFNVDDFVHIFDWVKPIISMHESSEKLRTWCTILFAELGAYAKRNIDWEDNAHSQKIDPFNRDNYLNRFDVLAEIPQLQEFRPERSDVKLLRTVKIATHKKKTAKEGVTDHLNDPYVFIPQAKRAKQNLPPDVTTSIDPVLLQNNTESSQPETPEQPRKRMKQMNSSVPNHKRGHKKAPNVNVNTPFKPVSAGNHSKQGPKG